MPNLLRHSQFNNTLSQLAQIETKYTEVNSTQIQQKTNGQCVK